jgi:hypothetical protein
MISQRLCLALSQINANYENLFLYVWVVYFDRSCLVYLHDSTSSSETSTPDFTSLIVSMNTSAGPISTVLLDENEVSTASQLTEDFPESLANRLSKRFGLQIFVSSNLHLANDSLTLYEVERNVVLLIKEYYDSEN